MQRPDWQGPLDLAATAARRWLDGVGDRPIRPDADLAEQLAAFDRPLPSGPSAASTVVADLVARAEPGLLAINSPRFHGWVMGGVTPAGLAADWLVSTWDQNAGMATPTPTTTAIEHVAARWIRELLGFDEDASVGFVTGGTMANLVCLAAARDAVLQAHGWDVESRGLVGGPAVRVIGSDHTHTAVGKALRILGLGQDRLVRVNTDANARIDPDALATAVAGAPGPLIVTVQAGDVHTGGIDHFDAIADVLDDVREHHPPGGVWLHVDGAVGLWAMASPRLRPSFAGVERADSWSTDAHKWLNTPYDCGIAITRHAAAHRRAFSMAGDYLVIDEAMANPGDWAPEMSRRARGVPVWATLASLGRAGVVEVVERTHHMAVRCARLLDAQDGVEVLNEVELNQVLVRFVDDAGEATTHTPAVLAAVQADGVAYPTHAAWGGGPAVRISVSHWATDTDDVDRTVAALLQAHARLRAVD
ncbi:pyridoxal phosphate-dependent decarboxylase family protein [Salsipaludibacter albus]|uniref:pyridoxal phosphate-dependent decarboxylase family protein n=1 Tax=Salsipaludibacter albus TaxID=2849650 RepID=UPI001EE48314|nr:pyridoxal-dependent decarboxylase [Salsipaludibacter albus]MBY5162041.1 aspartate aminotransferase family protein [Salsipaludibacter albus]